MLEKLKIDLSEPQWDIYTSDKNINLFHSGVGTGKSHLIGLISYHYITKFPKIIGFIGANTYEQLNTSTLKRVRDVWSSMDFEENVHYVVGKRPPPDFEQSHHNFDRYDSIISFCNGAVIYKASLDNYIAHEGKEFGWACLDETKDTKEEAVKEVIIARLRQIGLEKNGKPINPLYICTSPAKTDWINEWFNFDDFQTNITDRIFSKTDYYRRESEDKMVVISSTYHNQINLPRDYIRRIEDNNTAERSKALIYGNPFTKVGGEFYSSFDRFKHVKPCAYNPDIPIHISFDQNVVPYVTLKVYQVEFKDGIYYERHIDEFCMRSPDNTTEKACLEFKRKYNDISGLFFYGDPSGRHRDTRGQCNDYDIVQKTLRRHLNNGSNRVPYKHPPVIKRRDFANNIFDERTPIRIEIDPRCKETIKDYEYLREDENGKKLKDKTRDKQTGQAYEKYGHTSDADDYFRTQIFERFFEKY